MSTIQMPDGGRYRISSTRRYIVVQHLVSWGGGWKAIKRSDNLQTALTAWRGASRQMSSAPCHVIDRTADGGPAVIR